MRDPSRESGAPPSGAGAGAGPGAQSLLFPAVYANSFRSWNRAEATGLRTAALRFESPHHSAATRAAETFLAASRYRRDDPEMEASVQAYFQDPSLVMLSHLGETVEAGRRAVSLEGLALRLPMSLEEALRRRRSRRSYTGDAMGLDELASLLRAAGGVTGIGLAPLRSGGECALRFRSAPSGGGLYPIDLWVAAWRVAGLDAGLYRYDPVGARLLEEGGPDAARSCQAALPAPDEFLSVSRAGALVLLVARPWRSMRKYGARGLRFAFLEAGCISQSLHLAATALGLGTVDFGGYCDDELHAAMGVDAEKQAVIHTVVVGTAQEP